MTASERHARVVEKLAQETTDIGVVWSPELARYPIALLSIAKRHAPVSNTPLCTDPEHGDWPCPDFLDVEKVVSDAS